MIIAAQATSFSRSSLSHHSDKPKLDMQLGNR